MREYLKVGKGGLTIMLGRVLGTIFTFIITILLTRMLGPEQYGIFSYITGIIFLVSGILCSTLSLGLIKYVSSYAAREEWGKVKTIFLKIFKLSFIVGSFSTIFLFFISYVLPHNFLIKIISPYIFILVLTFVLA
ncbi:MAG: oligosaccharide flippase family protein, partial [Candidatus Aenigmarchaeota archaeon]|nr:oligosaccharide flippase family protein [Candidatus Aenigmarchaeota archaeon]